MATVTAPANSGRYHQSRQKREAPPAGVEPRHRVFVWHWSHVLAAVALGFILGLVVAIVATTIVH